MARATSHSINTLGAKLPASRPGEDGHAAAYSERVPVKITLSWTPLRLGMGAGAVAHRDWAKAASRPSAPFALAGGFANMLADDDPERVLANLGPNAGQIALAKRGFVQELVGSQRDEIIRHLRLLSPRDRRLRFGAPKTDASIDEYVHGIDFARDKVFGIFEPDLALTGVAHLALVVGREAAELGLSVVSDHRRKGYGYALLECAKLHARNLKYKKLCMHWLAENQVMFHLARKAGMSVVTEYGEADGHVALGG